MNVKYQVFVSSTYEDLKDERKEVSQGLLEINCIPAGMEMFPATSKEQWEVIKKVIDDCDYYLVIIAGKYGSIAESEGGEEISYTEKEFDYAVSIGKPVIALIRSNVEDLTINKVERSIKKAKKLKLFIEKAKKGRTVRFWDNKDNLKSSVISSLTYEIRENPQSGWIKPETTSDMDDRIFYLTDDEMGLEYLDLNNANYYNRVTINSLRETLRYYTERYSWEYGGSINAEPYNPLDKLIDIYHEDKSTAYTLRLATPLGKNMNTESGFVFHFRNCDSLAKMFLSYDIRYNHNSPIKFWVKIPPTLKFTHAILKYHDDRLRPTKVETIPIESVQYFEKIICGHHKKGAFYSLEWSVTASNIE